MCPLGPWDGLLWSNTVCTKGMGVGVGLGGFWGLASVLPWPRMACCSAEQTEQQTIPGHGSTPAKPVKPQASSSAVGTSMSVVKARWGWAPSACTSYAGNVASSSAVCHAENFFYMQDAQA